MESITIKDVIQSASGRNKDGFTKSAVGLFFEKVDGEALLPSQFSTKK
ncbi:MAG: hypothetical protein IJ899_19485 [Blautia sp.]|nr:hypothetical protein [Blautia sp.]